MDYPHQMPYPSPSERHKIRREIFDLQNTAAHILNFLFILPIWFVSLGFSLYLVPENLGFIPFTIGIVAAHLLAAGLCIPFLFGILILTSHLFMSYYSIGEAND